MRLALIFDAARRPLHCLLPLLEQQAARALPRRHRCGPTQRMPLSAGAPRRPSPPLASPHPLPPCRSPLRCTLCCPFISTAPLDRQRLSSPLLSPRVALHHAPARRALPRRAPPPRIVSPLTPAPLLLSSSRPSSIATDLDAAPTLMPISHPSLPAVCRHRISLPPPLHPRPSLLHPWTAGHSGKFLQGRSSARWMWVCCI